jgi:hypothetical protein
MKVTTFSKVCITLGASALLVGALAVPAQADPATGTFGTLVGLGSDTTQDVVNGLASAIGGNKIASYDATTLNSPFVVTRNGGTAIPRASGSGAGRDELRVAIGQVASAPIATPGTGGTQTATAANAIGNIDFARSSGDAGAAAVDGGVLTYIPFAKDAVSVAFDPTSPLSVVPFTLGSSADSTAPSLYNIYRGTIAYAYVSGAAGSYVYQGAGATNTVPAGFPSGTTAYAIHPVLPKSGSGTRSYFIGKIGLSESTGTPSIASLTTAGVIRDKIGTTPIEEHDGTAINGDLTAIGPFSISQWVAQADAVPGVTDRRHGVVLASLNGTSATTGSGTTFQTNPAYNAMVRDVYNIVPSNLADDPTSDIAKMFVGSGSLVCTQTATILQYGFQLESSTGASACGSTTMRAYPGSSSTTTLTAPTAAAIGGTYSVTADVTSISNGGGSVIFKQGTTVLATKTIASGATSATATVDAPEEFGTVSVTATFVPKLAGVLSSVSDAASVNVTGTASTVEISTPGSAKIGDAVGVIAWVGGVDAAGGKVDLYNGETKIATGTIGAGEFGKYLTFRATALETNLTAVYTAPANSTVLGSSSESKSLTISKGTPKVTVGAIKSVTSKANAKATVAVALTGVAVTGTVTVKFGSKTVGTGTLKSGKATITIAKLAKGSHKLTFTYNGSTTLNTAFKSSVVVKIK